MLASNDFLVQRSAVVPTFKRILRKSTSDLSERAKHILPISYRTLGLHTGHSLQRLNTPADLTFDSIRNADC